MLARGTSPVTGATMIPSPRLVLEPVVHDRLLSERRGPPRLFAQREVAQQQIESKTRTREDQLRLKKEMTESWQAKANEMPKLATIGPNQSLGMRASFGSFDFTPAARCQPTSSGPPLAELGVKTAVECEASCAARADCLAAQVGPRNIVGGLLPCYLYAQCLERTRAAAPNRFDVYHRLGASWPPGASPGTITWDTNATLVVVSYHASLSWLRTLPGGLMDVVVYHKADLGNRNLTYTPMAPQYVLSHLKEQVCPSLWPCMPSPPPMPRTRRSSIAQLPSSLWLRCMLACAQEICTSLIPQTTTTMLTTTAGRPVNLHLPPGVRGTLHHPRRAGCPQHCKCGLRPRHERPQLKYFSVVPNYGNTKKAPYGGSREPYGFFQFILDFWDNLPPVVIFSQDDCLARGCAWGKQLPSLGLRLQAWATEWGDGKSLTPRNCLCKYIREDKYRSRGYYWYRWMSFMQERVFNESMVNRSSVVMWPQDATFAVGRAAIRQQPFWMYEAMTRLMTVEVMLAQPLAVLTRNLLSLHAAPSRLFVACGFVV